MNTKPTLMLLPGLMCNEAVWTPLLSGLESVCDCRMVDHGLANDFGAMAQNVLDHAPEHFYLAGHSMGGRVALQVYHLAPERVQGMVLMDTGHLPLPSGQAGLDERAKRQVLLDLAHQQGLRAMAQEWVKGMVAPNRLNDTVLIDAILAMFDTKTVVHFERQIHALLHRPDGAQVLEVMRCPVTLICGELDAWSPVSQHQAMSEIVPSHPGVQVIRGAGHMCTMEAPGAVAQVMVDALSGMIRQVPSST
jgi:pimeloyl-ACP methyl ester carboxylesterase